MIKLFVTGCLFALSSLATAKSPYLVTCQSEQLILKVRRELKYNYTMNGWKNYWAVVEYVAKPKSMKPQSGAVEAQLSWLNENTPGRMYFGISMMEADEAKMRKEGIEGGSVGFGGFSYRKALGPKFVAPFQLHRSPQVLRELDIENHNMECMMAR